MLWNPLKNISHEKNIAHSFMAAVFYELLVQTSPDALLDGLHQDAHEGNFQTYFERYTSDGYPEPIKLSVGP